jgi:hypothetical protein
LSIGRSRAIGVLSGKARQKSGFRSWSKSGIQELQELQELQNS